MADELVASFVEGVKDAFRLAAYLFMAVASVITAFEKRELREPSTETKRKRPSDHS
jgi:hypothetical protein